MNYVSWIFGLLFLLGGIGYIGKSVLGGLLMLVIGLLIFPPIRKLAYSMTGKKISFWVRGGLVFIFLLCIGLVGDQAAKEQAQQEAAAKLEKVDYFNANRDDILSAVRRAVEAGDYQAAIAQSDKYLVSGDKELAEVRKLAKSRMADALKTERLLTQIKSVPETGYAKIKGLYQQLVALHPANKEYKSQLALYSGKIKAETDKLLANLAVVPLTEYEKRRDLYQQLVNLHPANDEYKSEFSSHSKKVKEEQEKQQVALVTKDLLSQLRSIPSSEYEKNQDLYQQLVVLHPTNEKYKSKVAFYSQKIEEALAQDIIVKTFSGSGGKNTRPFTVDDSWEIQWNSRGDIFQLYIYTADGDMVGVPANQQNPGKDSSYQAKGGNYYIKVNAIGRWTVKIVQLGKSSGSSSKNKKMDSSVIATFSGSGGKNTRPFTSSGPWEIQWDAKGDIFQLYLHTATGSMVGVPANQTGSGKGSSYQPRAGEYYLQVNAMGSWDIKIVNVLK